jgi:hypothetical protein
MSDIFGKVTSDQDFIKKILAKVPGFKGYIERTNRRASDKLLREFIATQFQELEQRISGLQRDFISQGELDKIDDLESSAIKIRQFTDRVKRATYGYSSLFESVKINEEELAKLYEYDHSLLEMADEVQSAIDNVETSIGTDGLPASIRHLNKLAQQCVDAFNARSSIVMMDTSSEE